MTTTGFRGNIRLLKTDCIVYLLIEKKKSRIKSVHAHVCVIGCKYAIDCCCVLEIPAGAEHHRATHDNLVLSITLFATDVPISGFR